MKRYDFNAVEDLLHNTENVLFCGQNSAVQALDFAEQCDDPKPLWYTSNLHDTATVLDQCPELMGYAINSKDYVPGIRQIVCPLADVAIVQTEYPAARILAYTKGSVEEAVRKRIPPCMLSGNGEYKVIELPSVSYRLNVITEQEAPRVDDNVLLLSQCVINAEVTSTSIGCQSSDGITKLTANIGGVIMEFREDTVLREFTVLQQTDKEVVFSSKVRVGASVQLDAEFRNKISAEDAMKIYEWFVAQVIKNYNNVDASSLHTIATLTEELCANNVMLVRGQDNYTVYIYSDYGTFTVAFDAVRSDIKVCGPNNVTVIESDIFSAVSVMRRFLKRLREILINRPHRSAIGSTILHEFESGLRVSEVISSTNDSTIIFNKSCTALNRYRLAPITVRYCKMDNTARLDIAEMSAAFNRYFTFLYADYIHDMLLDYDIKLEV